MTILLYDLVGADASRPFSPHCWKVAQAVAHKGLEVESVPTPFTKVKSVESGFANTVPVIRDGEKLVADSFDIAVYLDETYPDGPSLFGGQGGRASARFIERWTQMTLHPFMGARVLLDIYDRLAPVDQVHFRTTRESRFGKTLEDVVAGTEGGLAAWRASLEPLRSMLAYQPFIGGEQPLFHDYIVAGAFQWVRIVSPVQFLDPADAVAGWFERCLDANGGVMRRVAAAA